MEVKLKVLAGATAGREIKIPPQIKKFLIGRGEECHLRPKSDLISRLHCAVVVEDAKVFAVDQSKNGTYVNDTKIAAQQELQPGDRLKIGQLEFEVQFEVKMASAKKPKVKDVADAAARTMGSGTDSEADVMKWLEDDESGEISDTRRYMADTAALRQAMQPTEAESSADATVVDNSNSRVKALKKEPGKLPERPSAPPPKDSREAALKSLNKLFKKP
jgi:predicted component of type VI protein secretion system